jgi:hypothetical protein
VLLQCVYELAVPFRTTLGSVTIHHPYCCYTLPQEKNITRTNERPTLADREPHSQHFPTIHCSHSRNDIWVWAILVFGILGSCDSRCYFSVAHSTFGLIIVNLNCIGIILKYLSTMNFTYFSETIRP